jgi:hypothetical protein
MTTDAPSPLPVLTNEAAGLLRAIAHGFVTDGQVRFSAYVPSGDDGYKLSVDQEILSTVDECIARRNSQQLQTAQVHRLTVGDVLATSTDYPVRVLDDHDPNKPMEVAHASIDMMAGTRVQRQAHAAAMLLAATLVR